MYSTLTRAINVLYIRCFKIFVGNEWSYFLSQSKKNVPIYMGPQTHRFEIHQGAKKIHFSVFLRYK